MELVFKIHKNYNKNLTFLSEIIEEIMQNFTSKTYFIQQITKDTESLSDGKSSQRDGEVQYSQGFL